MTAKIIDVDDGDSDYDQAFQDARTSFHRLESLWAGPYEGVRHFMIKVCFDGVRRPIFLWLELTEILDNAYVGCVFESTDELTNVSEGDTVHVPKDLALDWLVNDHGVIHGGFTLLVERRRLSGQQLAAFDESLEAESWVDA